MTALTTTTATAPIDFLDYDDGEARADASYGKFDGAAINHWHGREGAIKNLGPYLLVNLFPELLKWSGKRVVDRILPEHGKPLPDVDKLNDAIDRRDWEEDFNGNPKGPWVKNYTLHFVDPETCTKLIVSNSTVGTRMAYSALKDATQLKRRFRGENVYPLVMLGEAQFRTSFGVKLRPDFPVVGWRILGAPAAPAIAAPVVAPALPGTPVAKVSAGEIVMDSLPDHPCPEGAPRSDDLPENL